MEIGTLIVVIPFLLMVLFGVLHKIYGRWPSNGFQFISVIFGIIWVFIALMICVVYMETSKYESERNSIQSTLTHARNSGSEYEVATITKDVMEFNRKLEVHQNFYHKHFSLWINDNIPEIEPVK